MLTIQPNLTTRPVKMISFRGDEVPEIDPSADNVKYQSKIHYYENKVDEFDKALQDKDTPSVMKKVIKFFKVVSEALLEGWAVAWGAKKGSNVIKPTLMKGVNGKFAKGASKVFKSVGKGLGKVSVAVSEVYGKMKATKFMTENTIGKKLSKGLEYVEKFAHWVGEKVSKWTAPLKGANAEAVYDKTAKAASTTMGVGAGAAGAYNSATGADKKAAEDVNKTDDVPQETADTELNEDLKFPKDGE